jgi:type IV pilus assembly protein PilQ
VLIEGRIVIASDTFARDLGAKFGLQGMRNGDRSQAISGSLGGNTSIINDGVFTRDVEGDTSSDGLNVNLPAGTFTGSPAAALAYTLLGRNFVLDLELSAMQEEGRGEIISNPRIVTANQREGVIKQGKEIGYVTISGGSAGQTANVQFKEAVLELRVTPTITGDGRVFLNLNVKKDEISEYLEVTSYGSVPVLDKREINTAVLVEDGQTVVIGGVYEFTDRESVSKVPFLGDIPFLGNLFKKKGRQKNKAELLIFITPKVLSVAKR